MALSCTCLGRLGSRYSLLLDPIRRCLHYGALGLWCQQEGELVIGLRHEDGTFESLLFCRDGEPFHSVEQFQSMTALRFTAYSVKLGVKLHVRITAPFWPRDEKTSLVPAYLLGFTIERSDTLVRWNRPDPDAPARGTLVLALRMPRTTIEPVGEDRLRLRYDVRARDVFETEGPGIVTDPASGAPRDSRRVNGLDGHADDRLLAVDGGWRIEGEALAADFDVRAQQCPSGDAVFTAAMVGYCGDALFERFGRAMPLKYTRHWAGADDVADWVRLHCGELLLKSDAFDRYYEDSSLPPAACDLGALAFQSYLINTLWAADPDAPAPGAAKGPDDGALPEGDWFSVWEGTCYFNSTVDVTYNEALFYFACWPQLLERIIEQWTHHANDVEGERRRRGRVSDDDRHGNPLVDFPGAILEHDMGAGWSANGQSYHHAMPVEENSNFLLLLYAHGVWWDRRDLFDRYAATITALSDYLLWCDSTGNGFPDRGTANTIDDATPAVQYGRDNVYLGVKRLAALHAAGRMFEHLGDRDRTRRCRAEVRRAVATLNTGWLEDHYLVVLDDSAEGLVDNLTGRPLPYDRLPGADAYSLYTANGLLYLLMVDDLPPDLRRARLRQDLHAALEHCRTPYGSSHSSADRQRVWISMNLWRDCIAAYLGDGLLDQCQRYWRQQAFANGPGGDKANAFTETSMTNNLVCYPRGTAWFGLSLAQARLIVRGEDGKRSTDAVADGRWPLPTLCQWDERTLTAAHRKGGGKTHIRSQSV